MLLRRDAPKQFMTASAAQAVHAEVQPAAAFIERTLPTHSRGGAQLVRTARRSGSIQLPSFHVIPNSRHAAKGGSVHSNRARTEAARTAHRTRPGTPPQGIFSTR